MNPTPYQRVARKILANHARDLPDLRGITVILPNYHVALPLAQALVRLARVPALLLPQMITLNEWAQSIPLDPPIIGEHQRSALLCRQLRKQQWFENAELWGMTRELLALFDELTQSLGGLAHDAVTFAAAVQHAYQARQNTALQLEARLVFELWHAMQGEGELDAARAYQQRLAILAARASRPLHVLRASDWSAVEQNFLDEYARRAPVEMFDLRESVDVLPSHKSPRFFAATSLEQEARAAAMQVRLWLQAGKRDIAIIAQDRVAARRVRALLERAGVLVADETGWTFATLSVSTVLMRWLDTLQSDFYHHDLLDLLKSPFVFAEIPAAERKAAVYRLEQLLRQQNVVAGLEDFATLAESEVLLHRPLARLRQAAALLTRHKSQPLAAWLAALGESLHVLGIDSGLQQDAAGVRLLGLLATWQKELAADEGRYRFAEWRRWLAQQLDVETFRDSSIDSPVRLTHLAATRWRTFDAVILLGCDAGHLPGTADGGRWFNDAVRGSLNLPTRATHAARQHDDLTALLMLNECVLVTWQQEQNGEARLLSPFLQMLRDERIRDGWDDLSEAVLSHYLAAEDTHRLALSPTIPAAPVVACEMLPSSVSISAYNALVACPYQFYARCILRLNELDEVQEGIEKRDYGERVHTILQRFHARYPAVGAHSAAHMETVLRQISAEVFADLLLHDFAAHAWLARWYKSLPAYLAWQESNETEGWCYSAAESAFELELDGIRLRGRSDRLDVKENECKVLDYKTQGDQLLRNKLKDPGEDVQLACYALAHQAGEAAFVSIDNGKVKTVGLKDDVAKLAQLNVERLEQMFLQMRNGAGLPANGIDQVCGYCEMRGLCRKGEWTV
ncbi:MAG: PD-(D/E)XK nuclease family protein [Pseudomonadota bacterium]